jgi:pyruvate carboxylase
VKVGDKVEKNQDLFVIEAMKMGTTICANADGKIKRIYLKEGTMVHSDDLVVEMEN